MLALLQAGTAPEEIAVVYRSPDGPAALVRSVFEAYGIPVAVSAPAPLRAVPLGRGLLGLLRAALSEAGRAEDVLAWLRTPGLLDRPGLADTLEADVRRKGAATAAAARALWEAKRWPLETLDRLAAARGRELLEAVAAAAETLLAAPHRRAAAILDPAERLDAAALREVLTVLNGLGALARQDRELAPSPSEPLEALERVEVREPAAPGCVQVLDPLSIRARRVSALFVCGLQEGEFPARPGRSPSCPTRCDASSPRPRAWPCAPATTCSMTSAPCSTPWRPVPRRCWGSPTAAPTRRATRRCARSSWTTCATSSPPAWTTSARSAPWPR